MELDEFIAAMDQIELFYSGLVKDKMIMQITDLKHFIDFYGEDIKLVNCTDQELCIVQVSDILKGIFFYEIPCDSEDILDAGLHILQHRSGVKDVWLVLVKEKGDLRCPPSTI